MKAFWAAVAHAAAKVAIWAAENPQQVIALVNAEQAVQKEVK